MCREPQIRESEGLGRGKLEGQKFPRDWLRVADDASGLVSYDIQSVLLHSAYRASFCSLDAPNSIGMFGWMSGATGGRQEFRRTVSL